MATVNNPKSSVLGEIFHRENNCDENFSPFFLSNSIMIETKMINKKRREEWKKRGAKFSIFSRLIELTAKTQNIYLITGVEIPENFTFIRNLVIYFIRIRCAKVSPPPLVHLPNEGEEEKFLRFSKVVFGSFCYRSHVSVYHQIIIPCCDFPSSCSPSHSPFSPPLHLCAQRKLFLFRPFLLLCFYGGNFQANPRIVIRRFPFNKKRDLSFS
jgi:hypothetical protein